MTTKLRRRVQATKSAIFAGNAQAAMVRAGNAFRYKLRMGNYLASRPPPTDVVDASCGPVRGNAYVQTDGRIVDGFLGIPYAKPPVGELRFKKPEPFDAWAEPRDCFQFGPRCPQNDELLGTFVNIVGKDEANCLTVNVFAPQWTSDEWPNGFPVMVFVHGGGFTVHSSSNYGDRTIARNLCTKDVVVVSLNYRLGAFGFLTTGDDVCRGNLGLWDQTLALKWVQAHIASFGGDPTNVTIFGQSAGGASVDFLSLSPHSRDLFQRVIPMAGCAECDFALRTNEQQAALTREFARFNGWTGDDDDTEGLLRWYDEQPIYKLETGITPRKNFLHSQAGNLYFVPNLDGDFLPKPISELRKEAPRKQVLTGTTEFEGLFFVALGGMPKTMDGLRKFLRIMYKECDFGDAAEGIRKEIFDFYTKGVDPKDRVRIAEQFVHAVGDYAINVGIFNYARKMTALGNDVYFYSFEHFNPHGFGIFKWLMPFLGATHCIEIRYVLGKGVISKFSPDESDQKMIEIMTNYFTNFAKYGNPNGRPSVEETPCTDVWEKHRVDEPFRHMRIQLPEPRMTDDYQARRAEFWETIRTRSLTRARL